VYSHNTTSDFHTLLNIPKSIEFFQYLSFIFDFSTACKFIGSRSGVDEVGILQAYDASSLGIWFSTSRVKRSKRMYFCWRISTRENETSTLSQNIVTQIPAYALSRPSRTGTSSCINCKMRQRYFSSHILRSSGSSHTTDGLAEWVCDSWDVIPSSLIAVLHVGLTDCTFRYMLISLYSTSTLIIPTNNSFAMCSVRCKQVCQLSRQLHADIPQKYEYIQNDAPRTAFLFPIFKTNRQRERKK
jgi:hypothetical protein